MTPLSFSRHKIAAEVHATTPTTPQWTFEVINLTTTNNQKLDRGATYPTPSIVSQIVDWSRQMIEHLDFHFYREFRTLSRVNLHTWT